MVTAVAETIRAFIAFKVPQETIRAVSGIQERLRRHRLTIKWVRPQGIHLTLKFLGDVPSGEVPGLADAMQRAAQGHQPLDLEARGIGVFPTIRRPRVLWVGLAGDTAGLIDFQQALERELSVMGFPQEKRSFKAHLTLGRVKGRVDSKELFAAMEPFLKFQGQPFRVQGVTLYQSILKPSGAVYTPLAEVPLQPGN